MKKQNVFKPKARVLKLTKDNKVFKLVLKSMKTKVEEFDAKKKELLARFKDEILQDGFKYDCAFETRFRKALHAKGYRETEK